MTTVTPGTELVEMASGVYARLHEGLTNGGIIIGDDSVLIIDSLRVPSFARDLIADIAHITDKPVKFVIDTHSHWDHAWGNEEFPDSTIIGHSNCRTEMLDIEAVDWWRNRVVTSGDPWAEEAKLVRVTPPDITFEDSIQMHFGGHRIDLRYLGRAHTSGDIFIHLPDENLVFTGDVAQDGGVPFMEDGYVSDWVHTDNRLVALEADRFVAGHGPIGERPALEAARDFIAELVDTTALAISDGEDEATTATNVTDRLHERFGDWRGFERVEDSVAYAYRQMTDA